MTKQNLNELAEMKDYAFDILLNLYHGEINESDIAQNFIKFLQDYLKNTQSPFLKETIQQGLKEANIKNQTLAGLIICLYKPVLTRKEQNTICEIYTQKLKT